MIFKGEFESRKFEVTQYFSFLKQIEDDFRLFTNYQKEEYFLVDDDKLKILKANGFLVLYNLIESTILNCVTAIFDEIKINKLSYIHLSENIKKYWSKNVYKFDATISEKKLLREKFYLIVENVISNMSPEISDRLEYGGSIDAKIIRDIAKELGVVFNDSGYRKEHHGKALEDIKKNRNDLAHGKKSFSDIARDITYNGVVEIDDYGFTKIKSFGLVHFKDFTIEHLEKFINSIEDFIKTEQYKASPN